MTLLTLRRRTRRRRPFGSLAAMSAGGLAAGALAYWFLDPRRGADHRRQVQEKLRGANEELSARTRELGKKAAETARTYQARASEGVRSLGERARGAAEEVRASAGEGAATLEARGVPRGQAFTGTAGAVLLLRAAMGGGLLRVPLALAGATLLSRAAGESDGLRRGMTRTRDAARTAAEKLHGLGADGGVVVGGGGGGGRTPEVREVKSPGELDAGIASGRPEPTFPDRVDRGGPHMGGGGRGRGWQASDAGRGDAGLEDVGLGAPGTDDVVGGRAGFEAPEPGAGVREEDLGVVAPRETRPEDEETPRIFGPGEGEAAPSSGGPEGLDAVSPLVTAPGAATPGEGAAPRIAGAEAEDPATRRAATEADAARRDPTTDGG